ncbi:MAG: hypothetical protein ABI194_04545, partial [Gemmatimonadaceae bacterium]
SSLLRSVARISDTVSHGRLGATLDRLFGSLAVDEREFEREYDFQPPFTLRRGMEITAEWFRQS